MFNIFLNIYKKTYNIKIKKQIKLIKRLLMQIKAICFLKQNLKMQILNNSACNDGFLEVPL